MKYNDPKLTVNSIVENERGEIIFIRRKNDPFKGEWDTPGGFLEPQETAEVAACREVLEETGLKLKPSALHYFGSYPDHYHHANGTVSHLLAIAFWCKVRGQKLKAGDDAAEVAFIDPKLIPWRTVPFESDREAYKDYLKLRSRQDHS